METSSRKIVATGLSTPKAFMSEDHLSLVNFRAQWGGGGGGRGFIHRFIERENVHHASIRYLQGCSFSYSVVGEGTIFQEILQWS